MNIHSPPDVAFEPARHRPLLAEAVRRLAGVCDYAEQQDGEGFAKNDAYYGHAIAAVPEDRWACEDDWCVWQMTRKYRNQLVDLGLEIGDIPEPAPPEGVQERWQDERRERTRLWKDSQDAERAKNERYIDWHEAEGVFSIRFALRGNEHLLDEVRSMPERRWNRHVENAWSVPGTHAGLVEAFANVHGFQVTEAAKARFLGPVASPAPMPQPLEAPPPPPAPPAAERTLVLAQERIECRFPFANSDRIRETLKSTPGFRFVKNETDTHWTIPLSVRGADAALSLLTRDGFSASDADRQRLSDLAGSGDENAARSREAEGKAFLIPGLLREPYPFQWTGAALLKQNGHVMVCDDQGLGKTIQSIMGVHARNAYPAVVVCPASVKLNWKREWDMTFAGKVIAVLSGKQDPGSLNGYDVVIVNYDLLADGWDETTEGANGKPLAKPRKEIRLSPVGQRIEELAPKSLILDEAHMIKAPDSQRAKACLRLAEGREVVAPLTGTPVLNQPKELINLLKATDKLDALGGFYHFIRRYCDYHEDKWGHPVWGASNLPELNQRLREEGCFIRRKKDDVLKELPPKRTSVIPVEIDNRKEYERVEEEFVSWVYEHFREDQRFYATIAHLPHDEQVKARNAYAASRAATAARAEKLVKANYLRLVLGKGKLAAVTELALNTVLSGSKLILFADHIDIQHALAKNLAEAKEGRTSLLGEAGVATLLGAHSAEERQRQIDRFQTDETCRVIVCSLMAGGTGWTGTAATDVLFAELGWTPALHAQAEDRCVLEGQPILTTSGWKPVETVAVGDQVIGHDGKPHAVLDTWNRRAKGSHAHNTKTITEITVLGWDKPLCVTSDHRILTPDGWKTAGTICPGEKILMPSGYGDGPVDSIPIDEDCRASKTFVAGDHLIFANTYDQPRLKPLTSQRNGRLVSLPSKVELTRDACFVFGYYLGDGFSQTTGKKGSFVSLAGHKDQKATYLSRCREWIEAYGVTTSLYDVKASQGCEVRAFSAELALWFTKHFGRIQPEKRIPEWAFEMSRENRRAFLDGLLASDGYVRPSRSGTTRFEFVTISDRLAADTIRLILSLDLKPCHTRTSKNLHSLQFTEGQSQALTVCRVTSRLPQKTERVYDLTVDESETFVVGTAVVHNCHRIGQTGSVLVRYVLGAGTFDDDVWDRLEDKKAICAGATDGLDVGAKSASGSVMDEAVDRLIASRKKAEKS